MHFDQDHVVSCIHIWMVGGTPGVLNATSTELREREQEYNSVDLPSFSRDQRQVIHSHSQRMPSIEFCQDGLFVRVATEGDARTMVLSIEDKELDRRVVLPCHIDELLAAARGLSVQVGDENAHLLISPEGESVCLSFSFGRGRSGSCIISKEDYERSLLSLRVELY
jgi:hypothetical protein